MTLRGRPLASCEDVTAVVAELEAVVEMKAVCRARKVGRRAVVDFAGKAVSTERH